MQDYHKYYKQGLEYKKLEKYIAATECFKKALNSNKLYAEAWQEAGTCLLQLNRTAEAGMHLQKALQEYKQRADTDTDKDYNLYKSAVVFALLDDKKNTLEKLDQAIKLNPVFAEQALSEKAFNFIKKHDFFKTSIQSKIKILEKLRFRGKQLRKIELTQKQILNRKIFIEKLKKGEWEVQDFDAELESLFGVAPQAKAEFTDNEHVEIELAYYLDENLLYMTLTNCYEEEDKQSYRIYKKGNIEEVLDIIIKNQSDLNYQNWEELIGELVELIDELYFEMPDARKVKIV